MNGAFRSGLQVKVAVACKLRESKCVLVKVFCCVIVCKAQVEVGNGLM